MDNRFLQQLQAFPPISLGDMESVSLMNRIDTKYLTTYDKLALLLNLASDKYKVLTMDKSCFFEYETTYFDTQERTMYLAHHNKRLTRQKVRVRVYKNSGDTFFEVKRKNNHGKTKKKRIQVESIETLFNDGADSFLEEVALLPIKLSDMMPYVSNHFERITLVNNQMTERLTIDSGLFFRNLVTGNDYDLTGLAVIEVKRAGMSYSPILDILRDLGIKPGGFSKYCIGAALTDSSLKKNNFKIKLRRIEKMINKQIF